MVRSSISFYTLVIFCREICRNVLPWLHETMSMPCPASERPPRGLHLSTRGNCWDLWVKNHQYNFVALCMQGFIKKFCKYSVHLRSIRSKLVRSDYFLIVKLLSNNNRAIHFSPLDLYILHMLAAQTKYTPNTCLWLEFSVITVCLESQPTCLCLIRIEKQLFKWIFWWKYIYFLRWTLRDMVGFIKEGLGGEMGKNPRRRVLLT